MFADRLRQPQIFFDNKNKKEPSAFVLHIDHEQTYLPKFSSSVTRTGHFESNQIDRMTLEINYFQNLSFDD